MNRIKGNSNQKNDLSNVKFVNQKNIIQVIPSHKWRHLSIFKWIGKKNLIRIVMKQRKWIKRPKLSWSWSWTYNMTLFMYNLDDFTFCDKVIGWCAFVPCYVGHTI